MREVRQRSELHRVALEERGAAHVGVQQAAQRRQRVQVRALVAVRGVQREAHERRADVVAGGERSRRVALVVPEHVAAVLDAVLAAQRQQVARQVPVERAGGVLHRDRHAVFAGVLSGCDRSVVDRDELGDVAVQHVRGAHADLLGNREQQVAVDRQRHARFAHCFRHREQRRDAGLVVEMARDDESVVREFRLRVDRDRVADVQAESHEVVEGRAALVEPQLDLFPRNGLRVDLLVVGVPGGLQRDDRSAQAPAVVGVHGGARAFGEARRPGADRDELEATVGLQRLDRRAERVEVRDDRAIGTVVLALEIGADRTAARQAVRDAQRAEFVRHVHDDLVGHPRRARNRQQARKHREQVRAVDRPGAGTRCGSVARCGYSGPGRSGRR